MHTVAAGGHWLPASQEQQYLNQQLTMLTNPK